MVQYSREHGQSEVLDAFANATSTQISSTEVAEDDSIGMRAATFTWNKETSGSSTPSSIRRNFKLQIDKDVFFKRGHINLVIGQTASGKTSLLMALLGRNCVHSSRVYPFTLP